MNHFGDLTVDISRLIAKMKKFSPSENLIMYISLAEPPVYNIEQW